MADSLPIPARAAVAREPLDPTAVVLGPQPLEAAERDGHQVIAGEVLKGRHRARGRRRGVAVSGAVLSAAGAFVTLALMVNHDAAPASASPRATPSTPIPDQPEQPTETADPDRTHPPAQAQAAPAARPAPARTAVRVSSAGAGQSAASASELRREALRSAEAWARAMQEANRAAGRRPEPVERYQAGGWQAPGHPEGHRGWGGRFRGAPGR